MNNNKTLMKANVCDGNKKTSQIFSCPFGRCFPHQIFSRSMQKETLMENFDFLVHLPVLGESVVPARCLRPGTKTTKFMNVEGTSIIYE